MDVEFNGEIWAWPGPAAWCFVTVPAEQSADLKEAAAPARTGWGTIPVAARVGATSWTTSLFPKDGGYIVPVKAQVRRAEGLEEGDAVTMRVTPNV